MTIHAPYLSPSGAAAPIYVVDRIDIIRIFVDIPERDADYVHIGSKASVLIRAYRDQPIPGDSHRTSWALNIKSRTLRAEIDLPNPGSQILPGMYGYAKVTIERPGVWALPVSALMHVGENTVAHVGNKTFCWMYEDGHAKRIELETGISGHARKRIPSKDQDAKLVEIGPGISDVQWIEVGRRRPSSFAGGVEPWTPIDGTEQVILGDLSVLADGSVVKVAATTQETKVRACQSTRGSFETLRNMELLQGL